MNAHTESGTLPGAISRSDSGNWLLNHLAEQRGQAIDQRIQIAAIVRKVMSVPLKFAWGNIFVNCRLAGQFRDRSEVGERLACVPGRLKGAKVRAEYRRLLARRQQSP